MELGRRAALRSGAGLTAIGLSGLAGCFGGGEDGDYPSSTVTWIIPYPEGSGIDAEMRGMQPLVSDEWGVDILIENIPGAGQLRAVNDLYGRQPDGYDLGYPLYSPGMAITYAGADDQPFDLTEFTGICSAGGYTTGIVARAGDFDDFEDLVDKFSNDDEFTHVGHLGVGHSWHLTWEVLKSDVGVEWEEHVAYDDNPSQVRALQAGEIDAAMMAPSTYVAEVEQGTIDLVIDLSTDPTPDVPDDADNWGDTDYDSLDHLTINDRVILGPPDMDEERQEEVIEYHTGIVDIPEVEEYNEENDRVVGRRLIGDEITEALADQYEFAQDEFDDII